MRKKRIFFFKLNVSTTSRKSNPTTLPTDTHRLNTVDEKTHARDVQSFITSSLLTMALISVS